MRASAPFSPRGWCATVSCPECMKALPYECTCAKSRLERLEAYARQAARELDLVRAIMEGLRPRVRFEAYDRGGRKVAEVAAEAAVAEEDEFYYRLAAEMPPLGADADVVMELEGADGEPLSKRRTGVKKGQALVANWYVGVPPEEAEA